MNAINQTYLVNKIFAEYKSTIENSIKFFLIRTKKMKKNSFDYEDMYQNIMLYLCEHLHKWDRTRSSISTYTQLLCKSAYSRDKRQRNAVKRQSEYNTISIDYVDIKNLICDDIETIIINKILYEDCIDLIIQHLGTEFGELFDLYYYNYNLNEINKILDTNYNIRQIQYKIKICLQLIRNYKKI